MIPQRPNPYSLHKPWSEDVFAARAAMPTYHGYVVALDFVNERDVAAQEALWREFCRTQPRHLWPSFLDGWKDRKRARGLA